MFASIQLGFVNDELRDMVLQDRIGHTTAVEFYNIAVNPSLADSLFAFKAPKNVDVIDETRH
jgi:outer membrane lipoprotein carrier protein